MQAEELKIMVEEIKRQKTEKQCVEFKSSASGLSYKII